MDEKLDLRNKLGMAFSGANITLFLITSAFITYFYTDVIGMKPAVLGIIFLVSKVFNGFSDLLFSSIIDKTRTAKGVCRPWIYRIVPFFGLGMIMLFTVPPTGNVGQIIYVFIVYNVSMTLIYSVSSVAVQSLPTYITRNAARQTELYAWNNVGVGIIAMLISGCTIKLVQVLGGTQKAWIIIAAIYAAIAMLFLWLTAHLCREKNNPDELMQEEEKISCLKSLRAIIQNKYWFYVLGIAVMAAGVYATSMQMHTYYAKCILKDVNRANVLNSVFLIPSLFLGILLIQVSGHLTAKKIVFIGSIIQAAGCVVVILCSSNIRLLIMGTILKGIGNCCGIGMFIAMLGSAIEYGQWKTGIRSQAMMIAANGAGQKIGNGIITGVLGFIMGAIGYNGMLEVQTATTLSGISALFLYIPLILTIIEIVLVLLFDLDKKYDNIMKDLSENKYFEKK